MIEITFTEIALFCWAGVATAYAFKQYERAEMLNHVLRLVIENEDARNKIVAEFKTFEEKVRAKT